MRRAGELRLSLIEAARRTCILAAVAPALTVTSATYEAAAQAPANVDAAQTVQRIEAITKPGGSDEWDAEVRPLLLEAYDRNKSGSIDTAGEVNAIPCDVLRAMDRLIQPYDNNRSGLTWTYGFKPGKFDWVGGSLGFDKRMRNQAFQRMRLCGVRTGAQ